VFFPECSVAFRWLLNDHEYVPHPELLLVREAVVKVSSRVIGVMSGIRLADVTSVFVQKMEERVSARKDPALRADANLLRTQALKLCAGEGVWVSGGTICEQLAGSSWCVDQICLQTSPVALRQKPAQCLLWSENASCTAHS
jgi:hypothetical protein